jgi:hypothetical protein
MAATFELERFAWADGAFEVAGRWRADEQRSLGRARLVVHIDGRRRRIGARGGKQATAGPEAPEWTARFTCQHRPGEVGAAELEVGGDLVIDLPAPELPPEEPEPVPPPPDVTGAEELLERLRSERSSLEAAAARLADERRAAEAAVTRLAEQRAGLVRSAAEAAEASQSVHEDVERTARQAAEQTARDVAREEAEHTARDVAREAAEEPAREAAERVVREQVAAAPSPTVRLPDGPPDSRDETATIPLPPLTRAMPESPRRREIRQALARPREPRGVFPQGQPQRALAYALALLIVIGIVVLVALLL